MTTLETLDLSLRALVIFRRLADDPVISRLSAVLAGSKSAAAQVGAYASFVSALYAHGGDLTGYILDRVLADENIYVFKRARKEPVDEALAECVEKELAVLEAVSRLTPEAVRADIGYGGYLPGWRVSHVDFVTAYMERMAHISTAGYGMYSRYHMFAVKDGAITPVGWPDPIRIADLKGYEMERREVVDNTLALLKGKPAANTLLYGDAGTGKSSTVKAIVNEYRDRGLRLIEITKKQFGLIPAIAEELSANPLRFILFIDDLSFKEEDDDFNALKAILEGSVTAKAPNLVIYATSNRRHLIKETFSDRAGDDVHRNETIQELCSLSDRFGLSVSFYSPDKALYLQIVKELCGQYGIYMETPARDLAAERYAFQRGGRSPRVARQFVEYLLSREG